MAVITIKLPIPEPGGADAPSQQELLAAAVAKWYEMGVSAVLIDPVECSQQLGGSVEHWTNWVAAVAARES